MSDDEDGGRRGMNVDNVAIAPTLSYRRTTASDVGALAWFPGGNGAPVPTAAAPPPAAPAGPATFRAVGDDGRTHSEEQRRRAFTAGGHASDAARAMACAC